MEHLIVEEQDGGGTATRDKQLTPINANCYIKGNGVKTDESSYSGTAYDGQTNGGGLLIIYTNMLIIGENGKFTSIGKPINGSSWSYKDDIYKSGGAGGGSGGGSINIFYKTNASGVSSSKFVLSENEYSPKGTYNVGTIATGNYVNLISNQ